jgi:hypothetical protein
VEHLTLAINGAVITHAVVSWHKARTKMLLNEAEKHLEAVNQASSAKNLLIGTIYTIAVF